MGRSHLRGRRIRAKIYSRGTTKQNPPSKNLTHIQRGTKTPSFLRRQVRCGEATLKNILANRSFDLSYIVEPQRWVIYWVGRTITQNLNAKSLLKARITISPYGLREQIVHFGSLGIFLSLPIKKMSSTCPVVLTCFHLDPQEPRLSLLAKGQKYVSQFHTSCQLTKNQLIKLGIPAKKISVIPLGVDLELFQPVSCEEKRKLKRKLGLPQDRLIIGSFQKDGRGWKQGLEPKLIKGPDIFVQVLAQIKKLKPFVLLSGPARGYVKKRLQKAGIPYKHFYLQNFWQMPKIYNTLDLYLITSRVEGGPKAILEAWACGVPVVSTPVGMIPDITQDNKNVLIAPINDIETLTQKVTQAFQQRALLERLIENGIRQVQKYSWSKIAKRYYSQIYQILLCLKNH